MRIAMRVIAGEHLALRAIARILKMDALLIKQGKTVDNALLRDIIEYVQTVPDKIHHPKEERYLFAAMRKRAPERTREILSRLYKEHQDENDLIAILSTALSNYEKDPDEQRHIFAQLALDYTDFLNGHIDLENFQAFPLAGEVLEEEDWETIDAAFAKNRDPIVSREEKSKFEALHKRIMDMSLPPFGTKQPDNKSS